MDSQTKSRTSLKLNVNGDGNSELPLKREVYKPIPEEQQNGSTTGTNGTHKPEDLRSEEITDTEQTTTPKLEIEGAKMVQEENGLTDGADEQMLRSEDIEKLAGKREEVKFIRGDHQNGDAKIDIGTVNGKAFTGMTKDELMKYANDPFWVRLRWIFFIAFWAIWAGMLVGAILIIVDAPKCAAPEPLPWYKRGLLGNFKSFDSGADDLAAAKKLQATGVIYELPAELTYSVRNPEVESKIKEIVAKYKDSDINIILDITPNYVTRESQMLKNALADETKRSPFVWVEKPEVPNNWLSVVNGSAWSEIQPGNFVLSQFGDGLYDLHMNDSIVTKELGEVLLHLLQLGVKGFRLKNTKFYLLSKNIQDEMPSNDPNGKIHTEYGFWTHTQTTFQEGLGDVLYNYLAVVKNASADAFLSVAEDLVRPEVYQTSTGELGIDMPIYGRFVNFLSAPQERNLQDELRKTLIAVGNHTWLQWNLAEVAPDSPVDPSAFELFMSLLPGVPVVSINSAIFRNVSEKTYKHIEQLRLSPSYMHGDFAIFDSASLVAYSRIKSGNPGYFVAFNPTDVTQQKNFDGLGLPDKMTVDAVSNNYNVTDISVKSKVMTASIEVSPFATIILTYVPVKSG